MNKRSAMETKQKIVAAAKVVFAQQPYEQVSVRTIAQASGVSVGGLYLYFRSKEELYRNLTEEWMAELHQETVAALDTVSIPSEAVAVFVRVSLQYALKHKGMILTQGKDAGCSVVTDLKKEFFRQRRTMLTDIIRQGMETGDFDRWDPEEAAKVIFNILRGFFISMIVEEEALFLPESCERLVLQGLVRRSRG